MRRKPNLVIYGSFQNFGKSARASVHYLSVLRNFRGPGSNQKARFSCLDFFFTFFPLSSLLIQHKTQSFIFTLAFVFLFGVSMAGLGGEIGGEREIFDHLPSGLSRFVFGRLPLGPGEILRSIHHQTARPNGSCSKHRTLVTYVYSDRAIRSSPCTASLL